jgi:hypothetical protein
MSSLAVVWRLYWNVRNVFRFGYNDVTHGHDSSNCIFEHGNLVHSVLCIYITRRVKF